MALIAPHGADELRPLIVDDTRRAELEAEALTLPSLMVSSAAAANAVMMGAGYFTPLSRLHESRRCALRWRRTCAPTDGLFWPVPVVNLAESCPVEAGQRLALTDP
jgi:sulfate adenylyltransferase